MTRATNFGYDSSSPTNNHFGHKYAKKGWCLSEYRETNQNDSLNNIEAQLHSSIADLEAFMSTLDTRAPSPPLQPLSLSSERKRYESHSTSSFSPLSEATSSGVFSNRSASSTELQLNFVTILMEAHEALTEILQQSLNCSPDSFAKNIFTLFQDKRLLDRQVLEGEPQIRQYLKFCTRVPLANTRTMDNYQEKSIHRMRTALLKECGFTIYTRLMPVIAYKKSDEKSKRLIILVTAKNTEDQWFHLDSSGKVFKSLRDWMKYNDLSTSTKYIYSLATAVESEPNPGYTLVGDNGSSKRKRHRKWQVADSIVIVGALGIAAVSIAVPGSIILAAPLVFGEAVAASYMGYRGYTMVKRTQKHKAKLR